MEYNFRGKEQSKTLEQLVSIYESQIVNLGTPEYIQALAELIQERYENQGISDYDVFAEPEAEEIISPSNQTVALKYEEFEAKIIAIIEAYKKGEIWAVKRGTIKAYRN